MTATPPLPPAGWYPDDNDASKEIYWDGAAWTNARRPRQSALPNGTSAPATKQRKPTSCLAVGCLSVVVLIVIMVIIGAMSSGSKGPSTPNAPNAPVADVGDKYGAWDVCQQTVSDMLKAPATAGYPMTSEFDITQSGETFKMRAWVDSQNSFGAQIRTFFTCVAKHTTGDNYTVKANLE